MPPEPKRTQSKARFITPLAVLPIVLPSTVIAVLYAVGATPWDAAGAPVWNDLREALFVAIPTLVWAGSWLIPWDGDPAFPERRVITCGIACALALVVYLLVGAAAMMWSLGNALN